MASTATTVTVLSGGPILTMDPARPEADTVVVGDGRVLQVGDRQLAEAYPHAARHDLAGRTLVPGFIDAHCHLSIAALQPLWVDLAGVSTRDGLDEALRRQLARTPEDAWLRGDDWDEVTTGLTFDRRDLDAIAADRPAIVMHATYHQAVLNSAALDLLRIGRQAAREDPLIAVDGTGEPTGLLMERSAGRAHTASLAAYADADRWADHVERHATELLRHGITAVHDAAVDPAAEAVYGLLAAQRRLPVSVLVMPAGVPFLTNDAGDRLEGPPTGSGDEQLRVGAMKLFADGGAMPAFDVHIGGAPLVMGYRHPDLAATARTAVERGFRVGAHAIGNQGVRDALEAFEAAAAVRPDDDHRFRIEHFGMGDRTLATRAAELGAVAVVQPGFVEHVGRNARGFEPDDATWLPFATLVGAGVVLAGSSDDPCGPLAPLDCARLGVHRHSDGHPFGVAESVPVDMWLAAYTRGAAFAGGQEHERGTITAGKVGDFVVLDLGEAAEDPVVAETWVGGRPVYRRGAAAGPIC